MELGKYARYGDWIFRADKFYDKVISLMCSTQSTIGEIVHRSLRQEYHLILGLKDYKCDTSTQTRDLQIYELLLQGLKYNAMRRLTEKQYIKLTPAFEACEMMFRNSRKYGYGKTQVEKDVLQTLRENPKLDFHTVYRKLKRVIRTEQVKYMYQLDGKYLTNANCRRVEELYNNQKKDLEEALEQGLEELKARKG